MPFGLVIAKLHKKDLRAIGSGNIGATNVSRALGRRWGYICFVLDVCKGLCPTLMARMLLAQKLLSQGYTEQQFLLVWLLIGCAAVLGHVFPVYIRFRGGKGVATSFGVALGLWPYFTVCAVISLVIWLISLWKWRYISLASILASLMVPVFLFILTWLLPSWRFLSIWPLFIIALGIPLLVILRHRANMTRIYNGTESKVSFRKRVKDSNP
jgi:glycerol-3-phosphate acyltransferase PlsY